MAGGCLGTGGGAGVVAAFTRQRGRTQGRQVDGIGTALIDGAGVIGAGGAGQFIEAPIEDSALGGIDAAVDLDHPVADRFDGDPTLPARLPRPPYGLGVHLDDHPVHQFGDALI
ncbi:hypothetical protein MYFR107205_23900 [Mycolicibacterium frederiksbergense]